MGFSKQIYVRVFVRIISFLEAVSLQQKVLTENSETHFLCEIQFI